MTQKTFANVLNRADQAPPSELRIWNGLDVQALVGTEFFGAMARQYLDGQLPPHWHC